MKIKRLLPLLFSIAFLSLPMLAQTQTDVRPLSVGQPIERELKGDEAHSYSIAVSTSQYLHVVVDQRGIDVVVMLFGADGKKLAEVDSPNGTFGPEPLSVIIGTSGNYRLEIRSLEKSAPAGRYEAKVVELRPAIARDNIKMAAQKAFAEAEALRFQGEMESMRGAIKKYEEAIPLYQSAGDKQGEADTLNIIGVAYSALGEKQQALKYYNESLPLFRAVGDKQSEAVTFNNIGTVYDKLGEKQQALRYYNDSLLLYRAAGDKKGEADALNNIGSFYYGLRENQEALKYYNEALPIFRLFGDKQGEAITLNNIGTVYDNLAEKERALEYYNESLRLFRAGDDKRGESDALNNIGAVYDGLGEKRQALKYYNESLLIYRTVGDKEGEADALGNIGYIYSALGEKQKALKYLSESLPLSREVGDKQSVAVTLNNIGYLYSGLGQRQQALKYYNEALPLRRTVGDKGGEASTLNNIGLVYHRSGASRQALKYYNESLPLTRAAGKKDDEAATLKNIFSIFALSNPRFAVFYGKLSVNNYQAVRSNIRGIDKNIQKTFLRSIEDIYRKLADALIRQRRLAEAQQTLNLFKDQEYFDFNSRKQTVPLTLTKRESSLSSVFNQKLENIVLAMRQIDSYKRSIGLREPNQAEIHQIRTYEANLKTANGDYVAFLKAAESELSQPPSAKDKVAEVTDAKEMQNALRNLQAQTGQNVVAIYTLEVEGTYRGLLITPDKIAAVSYPIKVAELKKKEVQFFGQLSEVDKQTGDPKATEGDVQKSGKELYDIVFAPVAAKLKELNINPDVLMWSLDGALRYLPVAALYDGKQYMAERYRNVVFTRANSERMLAAVSPTWTGSGFYNSKEHSLPIRSPDDGKMKLVGFDGLKNAKTEVETIFGVSPKRGIIGGNSLSNDQFTKDSLFKELKLNRPLVHIASHFKFEAGDASSSFLLLGDGTKLTLEDIKNAPDELFKGVELLTLSACETGVQKERESDGREIDGFAELAQRKGAKAVMASLWKVDDESTSQLMTQFYQTRETEKLTKAEAMQKAQLSLIGSKDFSHPYYWSPFILIGNWR